MVPKVLIYGSLHNVRATLEADLERQYRDGWRVAAMTSEQAGLTVVVLEKPVPADG